MFNYRQATDNDLEKLLGLIELGFSVHSSAVNTHVGTQFLREGTQPFREDPQSLEGYEHRVLFSHLYSLDHAGLARVELAEDQGRLIAAVGLFPQHLFFQNIKIPVWAISPVVTHPDYRGSGVAGHCLTSTLENLRQQGIPAVFLWGLPGYYPRFGFVPLLPRYKTKLVREQLITAPAKCRLISGGGLRKAAPEDITVISDLYNQGNQRFWLQPERTPLWWRDRFAEMNIPDAVLKEVPFPKKENFLVWENSQGMIAGYLNYESIPGSKKLIISEGAAADPQSAVDMMATFVTEYLKSGWILYLRGTPEHFLNAALYRLGGIHLNPAPLAGMVKIIDWTCFFNYLKPLYQERLQNCKPSFDLPDIKMNDVIHGWRWDPHDGMRFEDAKSRRPENLAMEEAELTRLILGVHDPIDGCHRDYTHLKMLFPMKYPFIWDANYLY